MKRSKYATKQGRASEKKDGKRVRTGRTRYAPTSPFSPEHRTDSAHRLAQYHARGEAVYALSLRAARGDVEAYRELKAMGFRVPRPELRAEWDA